ncbi:conserved hypothetical protein [Candidatus Desulfosporosinus infrequens]|uniref:Uncharacterized protein n=1 Tax=Candidatus Desulfosporosinus infrequens TaxID=2043169 RepID=A0A2U3KV50_9FIRM|nr:conserved hypothetical protein [Candidatus Desulfosporosinus infrequens]
MTPSGVYTPASVEIAVKATQERDELLSSGKVVLSLSPWGEGVTSTGVMTPPSLPTPIGQAPPGSIAPGPAPTPAVTNPVNKAK